MIGDRTSAPHPAVTGQILRDETSELRFALDAGGVGVWQLDLASGEMTTSAACRRTFGRDPAEPFPYEALREAVHPVDRERMAAAVARTIETGCEYDIEYRAVTPAGDVRWVQIRARLDRAPDGTPMRMAGISIDVTQRRQAEIRRAALVELGERIRDLDDTAGLAYAAAEILGRTLGVSRAGYGTVDPVSETITIERDWNAPGIASLAGVLRFRDYGSYIEDLKLGRTVVFADAEADPRTVDGAAALKAISAQSVVNMPVTESGGMVALLYLNHATARPWTDEELSLIAEVAARTRTAVERIRVRQELRNLAASLERQVEARTAERDMAWKHSQDLQVVVDRHGTIQAANDAWGDILGWDPCEVVGRHHLSFNHVEHHEASERALARSLEGELPPHETRCLCKDGGTRWIAWVAAGEGDMVYASGRDVTAEREAAAELAAMQEQLRQSQKLEAVGQLTGGVAHDFNNLLTIIRSSVDFLRRPDLPEARKDRYLNAVSETVDRAAKLTGQLLAFARRQALNPEVFDIGRKVRGIAEMLDTVTGARVRVVTEVPDAPCFVRADLSQFETALVNMAVNARDAMDGEGMLTLRLACDAALPAIRGHAGSGNAFAAISLTDTGSGIPPDRLARIFEPFFTTKEVGKGTGLGLSQVFGFAKQSGGDVDVVSTVGEGTTITLYLPEVAAEEGPARDRSEAGEPAPLGTGQRILVVEDNIGVGQFATQILEDLGYRPAWAANAEEALDRLGGDGDGFDLVFSDVVMPGMGGVELAKALQRRLPHMPVVLASGYSDVLAQEGTHGFELLQKPYSAEQLGRILHRSLGVADILSTDAPRGAAYTLPSHRWQGLR